MLVKRSHSHIFSGLECGIKGNAMQGSSPKTPNKLNHHLNDRVD